jgi:tetratricopeptide (TPR) repeat protein
MLRTQPIVEGYLISLVMLMMGSWQMAGQTRSPSPAPQPSSATRPDSIQDSGLYDYWAQMSGQGRAGGVLLGKLAVEGGHLPWQPLLVSVLCKGTVVNKTQTDLQGRYVIRFTNANGMAGVPEDAQRQMERQYEGCTVQAMLAGFHSSTVTITQHNLLDEPNLATIMLSPEGRSGGTEVSSTTATAPGNAMKEFEKARAEWLDQKPDSAEKDLEKAVKLYPSFAEAWLQLGKLQEPSDPKRAHDSFMQALAADPNYVLPYEQLAALAAQDQKWQGTLDNTSHALLLDPTGTPQVWYYDALAKYQLGKTDDAQASVVKALAIDPRHSQLGTEQLLAVILARKADYAGALEHLRNSLTYLPSGPNADLVKQQIAQLEQKMPADK